MVRLVLTEWHSVRVDKTYDLEENDLVEAFGSMDAFWEAYVDETDEFWQYMWDSDYDREEDWVSDRKGYTETEWNVAEDEDV